jgi:hypothetical protein
MKAPPRAPTSATAPTSPAPDKTAGRKPRPIDKDNIFATP